MQEYISEFKATIIVSVNAVGVGIVSLLSDRYLSLDDVYKGLIILCIAVMLESVTGWRAMYLKLKSGEKVIEKDKSFTTQVGLHELFNKTIAYVTGLVLGALISDWLNHPTFHLWFLPEMGIVAILTTLFMLIEVIQIYVNFKGMGIDIGKMITDFAKEFWGVFKAVKNDKD